MIDNYTVAGFALLIIWFAQLLVQVGNLISQTMLEVWKAEHVHAQSIKVSPPTQEARILCYILFWVGLALIFVGLFV